jgi:fructose-1,6-bisphosphatase/sedoheptulose 1,7-bisphosphatase-like protein
MGIKDKNKIYEAEDLAPGNTTRFFAATDVHRRVSLLKGSCAFFGEGTRTSSVAT